MTFELNQESFIGKVVLKVNNLQNMTDFYQNKIGLDTLKSSEDFAVLGIQEDDRELLEIRKVENPDPFTMKSGLFHLAFVVPTRRDLGNILYSLLAVKQVDVQGASDHGYSEAIYLADPENNGIEIYRDKPKEEWDILEDGTIKGITIQMDADGVIDSRDSVPKDKMPQGTKMGHVHLRVSNLEKSEEFYSNVLGLDLKYHFGSQALFYAAGVYHHHVGLNTWQSRGATSPTEKGLGLAYFTVKVPHEEALNEVKENIQDSHYEIFEETETSFKVNDVNGITLQLVIGKD